MTVAMAYAIRQNPAYKLIAFDKRPLAKLRKRPFIMDISSFGNQCATHKPHYLLLLVVIDACRSTTVPSPVLQPVATTDNNDTSTKSINSWVLTPNREPHTYHSISQTIVHELSNSTTHQNTTEISTTFTISID